MRVESSVIHLSAGKMMRDRVFERKVAVGAGTLAGMVGMGEHDALENRYTPRFEVLLSESGVVVEYRRDRAGIDTGLHLFAREERTSRNQDGKPYWRALAGRVWFQLKGIHESTMSADAFRSADHITITVESEHLKFWYAAPEPVYLVVYIEAVDLFVGTDVRDLVDRQWGESFYASMRDRNGKVSVRVPTTALMNPRRIAALVEHRSMRIDGPAFRGRPLGHRMDPLRSVLACPPADLWLKMTMRILQVHDFREASREPSGELTFVRGVLAQTLLWQSPAFAEYGYQHADEVRDEPVPEQIFGRTFIILDSARDRAALSDDEVRELDRFLNKAAADEASVAVLFRGRDLSGTGGFWRSTMHESVVGDRTGGWHQLGLEALSSLVLTATLVYLEFAPDLDWENPHYLQ